MLNDALKVNDQTIQIDHEGYLLEASDWNEEVAHVIAEKEGVEFNEAAGM
jgi:sulfur relay (sulfurtransferase) DsrC/TusE family protein